MLKSSCKPFIGEFSAKLKAALRWKLGWFCEHVPPLCSAGGFHLPRKRSCRCCDLQAKENSVRKRAADELSLSCCLGSPEFVYLYTPNSRCLEPRPARSRWLAGMFSAHRRCFHSGKENGSQKFSSFRLESMNSQLKWPCSSRWDSPRLTEITPKLDKTLQQKHDKNKLLFSSDTCRFCKPWAAFFKAFAVDDQHPNKSSNYNPQAFLIT